MGSDRCYPPLEDVKRRFMAAVLALYRYEHDLLDVGANERSITHKLAEHLQSEFPGWHVDCEYNRQGGAPKRLEWAGWLSRPDDTEAKTVYPDIIVHHRRTKDNLLVIEVKKHGGQADTKDKCKLETFLMDPAYQYRYGVFLRLGAGEVAECTFFEAGGTGGSWTSELQAALQECGHAE
jgi:hypothetical protein